MDAIKAIGRRVRVVNHNYDIPYIAGYSKDGHTIFIDTVASALCQDCCVRSGLAAFASGLRNYRSRRSRATKASAGPRSFDFRNGEPAAARSSRRLPWQRIDVSRDIDRPRSGSLWRAMDEVISIRKESYLEEIYVAQSRDHRCRHSGGRRLHGDRCDCARRRPRRQWRPIWR